MAPGRQAGRPHRACSRTRDGGELNRRRSYTTYSAAVGIVWAVVLVLTWLFAPASKQHTIFLVFGGFAIGWLSATIARYVYPPPRKYQQDGSTTA